METLLGHFEKRYFLLKLILQFLLQLMEKFGRRIIPAFGHTVRRCRHTSSSSLPSVLSKNSIKIEIIVKVGGLL